MGAVLLNPTSSRLKKKLRILDKALAQRLKRRHYHIKIHNSKSFTPHQRRNSRLFSTSVTPGSGRRNGFRHRKAKSTIANSSFNSLVRLFPIFQQPSIETLAFSQLLKAIYYVLESLIPTYPTVLPNQATLGYLSAFRIPVTIPSTSTLFGDSTSSLQLAQRQKTASQMKGILKQAKQTLHNVSDSFSPTEDDSVELPIIPIMYVRKSQLDRRSSALIGHIRAPYHTLDSDVTNRIPQEVVDRMLTVTNWVGEALERDPRSYLNPQPEQTLRWSDDVVFNERSVESYVRETTLADTAVLKSVSLPLKLEELPLVLRQEIDIISGLFPDVQELENLFITIPATDEVYWKMKDERDENDRTLASTGQNDPRDEGDKYGEVLHGQMAQLRLAEDEEIADGWSTIAVDNNGTHSNSIKGPWQPGDPTSDSDSDGYSSEEDGIYTHFPASPASNHIQTLIEDANSSDIATRGSSRL